MGSICGRLREEVGLDDEFQDVEATVRDLIGSANDAENDEERGDVISAIMFVIEYESSSIRFSTPQAVAALTKMVDEAENNDTRRKIERAMTLIAEENPGANILSTLPNSRELLLKLQGAIAKYNAENPSEPSPTLVHKLLDRILNEDVEERGGLRSIIAMVTPIITAFT